MKNVLTDFLKGDSSPGADVGSASPDFKLAGDDEEMEGEGSGLLTEVEGMLGSASDEQLQQIKDILAKPAAPAGGDMGGGMPPMGDLGGM